jgi:hypothetical protein
VPPARCTGIRPMLTGVLLQRGSVASC